MSDMVTLTLAHPLNQQQAERVHAKDKKDYGIGDKIVVPKDDARAIINAGFADGIDPDDRDRVREVLEGGTAAKSAKSGS